MVIFTRSTTNNDEESLTLPLNQHSEYSVNLETHQEDNMAKNSIFRKAYIICNVLVRLSLMIVSRFWKMCTTGLLIGTLLFWTEGGSYAFFFFVLGVLGLMYNAQDMLLYHPEAPPDSRMIVMTPAAFHMPFENHTVLSRDGTHINVVFIKQAQKASATIVFFHGNAGNIGHRLQNALGLYSALNSNILMVEYRGYGKSHGSPSESGLYQDSAAAMDFLLKRTDVDLSKIVLFGRSLGGAVAIQLASSSYYGPKLAALVVENTFTSIYEMGHRLLRLNCLKFLPRCFYKNKYPSIERIDRVSAPVLFLSGSLDELVPSKMMKDLYNKSKSSMKRLETFTSGTHNDTWTNPGYYEAWMRFLPEALRLSGSSANIQGSTVDFGMDSVMAI